MWDASMAVTCEGGEGMYVPVEQPMQSHLDGQPELGKHEVHTGHLIAPICTGVAPAPSTRVEPIVKTF